MQQLGESFTAAWFKDEKTYVLKWQSFSHQRKTTGYVTERGKKRPISELGLFLASSCEFMLRDMHEIEYIRIYINIYIYRPYIIFLTVESTRQLDTLFRLLGSARLTSAGQQGYPRGYLDW